mgnify:CR=1 FL=1
MVDVYSLLLFCFFFQAEDGIRDLVRSRGLGDVYKRQVVDVGALDELALPLGQAAKLRPQVGAEGVGPLHACLLYTSDAADDLRCVDLGGRRIIKKKKEYHLIAQTTDIALN